MLRSLFSAVTAGLALSAASLTGQTLAFDVASIKQSEPITPAMVQAGKIHVGMKIDGARVDIGNFTLLQLIAKAYDVKMYQVQGPSWMTPAAQRFDIIGNLPPGATKEQVPQMLQTLLADRFKLVVHKEDKEQKVYALIVGKDGPKIKQTQEEPASPDAPAPNPAVTGSNAVTVTQSKGASEVSNGEGLRQRMIPSPDGKSMRFEITKATIALMAEGLTPLVDRPIVDMTGLKGNYDMAFDVSMQDLMNAARAAGANVPANAPGAASSAPGEAASDPGGSIFTAIQSLGLKLDARKAPLMTIVIDQAEKLPTAN